MTALSQDASFFGTSDILKLSNILKPRVNPIIGVSLTIVEQYRWKQHDHKLSIQTIINHYYF